MLANACSKLARLTIPTSLLARADQVIE